MNKVLIVEDSNLFSKLLKRRVEDVFHFDCVVRTSYQDAVDLLEEPSQNFLLAILDLTLPGSPDGEIVDHVISKNIPVIVVTGRMDDHIRENILSKHVLDYIMKGPHTLDLLVSTIHRFLYNKDTTILLVDDSEISRNVACKILKTQYFNILEAKNGKKALELIKDTSNIKLVLTDYNMPEMDGYELTAGIRINHPMDKMAIIGMSAHGNPLLSAQFLKRGANDFIAKPYFEEELIWRVNQNIKMLEHLELLRESTIRDPLTGMHNRRYFFQAGEKLYKNAARQNLEICVAMVDIDKFKLVNDNYGHLSGDIVLKQVGRILQEKFRDSDIVARFGGEEFIIMTANMSKLHIAEHFEDLRQQIANQKMKIKDNEIQVTASFGVTTLLQDDLEEMVSIADKQLYIAKEAGRNQVRIES